MKRAIGTILGLFIALGASNASAQNWIWSVPGIVDNGAVKTAVACTNNNSLASATVTVEAYNGVGTLVGSASLAIGANETKLFGTSNLINFPSDASLGAGNLLLVGHAKILSSIKTRLNCSAWLEAGSSMAALTVIKKDKQKGQ